MASLPIVNAPASTPHVPGPHERALDEVWQLARSRLYRFGWLRPSFALHRRFHLRLLKINDLRVAIPGGQVPDCDNCTDICCTGPNAIVSLRLRDIAALCDAGLSHAIVTRAEPQAGSPRLASWARRQADASVFHRAFPVLARDATGTCVLLTEDRRCGAWPAWPMSCARYPYSLDLQHKVVFWAKGCGHRMVLPAQEAPPRVRALVRAVVDSYNDRVKDIVMIHLAAERLDAMGLLKYVRLDLIRSARDHGRQPTRTVDT